MTVKRHKIQKGGSSTDYSQSFYAYHADPAQLSRYTLQYIPESPLFNPLQTNVVFPTGTSGIIPTGTYFDTIAPLTLQNAIGPPVAQYSQLGGGTKSKVLFVTPSGKSITNPWIAHVFKFAKQHNLNYAEALKHPKLRQNYKSRIFK